jgi:hypothetical protein
MHSMRVPGHGKQDRGPGRSGARELVMRIACAAIAVAAAVTLGLSVHHDLRATASVEQPAWARGATAAYRQEECIYHAVQSALPQGATVYISAPAASWRNAPRLIEYSTPWAVPQLTPATARWTLSLVPKPGHCSGWALKVGRR